MLPSCSHPSGSRKVRFHAVHQGLWHRLPGAHEGGDSAGARQGRVPGEGARAGRAQPPPLSSSSSSSSSSALGLIVLVVVLALDLDLAPVLELAIDVVLVVLTVLLRALSP